LIIPHIGRSKFVVKQELHGRNMLISEYLWHDYLLTLPPGVEPYEKEYRGRKQVSSHIQVLKGIFRTHRCCKSAVGARLLFGWRSAVCPVSIPG
jgi:transcriptional enhancer factor